MIEPYYFKRACNFNLDVISNNNNNTFNAKAINCSVNTNAVSSVFTMTNNQKRSRVQYLSISKNVIVIKSNGMNGTHGFQNNVKQNVSFKNINQITAINISLAKDNIF